VFRKLLSLCLIFSIAGLATGCSTITKGNRQLVSISSEPTGAKVKIGSLKGKTPYTVDLATNKDYVANISLDGYSDEQVQITKTFRTGTTVLGNILWLLVGVIVDVASGSAYGLNPTDVNIELEKE
jgi:hypothetical protein